MILVISVVVSIPIVLVKSEEASKSFWNEKISLTLLIAISIYIITIYFTFKKKLNTLIKNKSNDIAIPYQTSRELYKACADAFESALHIQNNAFVIRHAALHASLGHERVSTTKSSPPYSKFDKLMSELVQKSRANTWEIRTIFLVPYEQRLDFLIERLMKKEFSSGRNFFVKVFIPPFTIPYTSPLIIGEDKCFLSFDASSEYRVKNGIQLNGTENVKIFIEYFDSIWNNPNSFEIRSANKLNLKKIEEVRELLNKFSANK